jgi:hypothetical protein
MPSQVSRYAPGMVHPGIGAFWHVFATQESAVHWLLSVQIGSHVPEGLQKVLVPQLGHILAELSDGGMHVLLTQAFRVQKLPSLQPKSSIHGSSASRIVRKANFYSDLQGMSHHW